MLFRPILAFLTPAALLLPMPAMAQVQGTWRVTGVIDGNAFAVDCAFEPQGNQFNGKCTDVLTGDKGKAGKVHTLTQGNVTGNNVRWTYVTKVMFMSVDINFAGTLSGNHMSGSITAKGRKGSFAAVRNPA
ncbi:hypothetical protein MOK15_02255 [Sphingobium sp. BYY-5]|uniref:hypothetical protein n=1 Tax=Sphingobium sp. BYY-5 TaxID=2926400 RepID=UPI001FA74F4A|nr:hypothetical protein [Sphingobium sp. BYY-5]MCI4588930.1 hypothetical protein [Sphingobium sp. BYY-5]